MANNNPHSFACTCEGKNLQYLKNFILSQRVSQMNLFNCSVNQFQIKTLWNLHQSNFIRTWCLVNLLTILLTWSHVMTYCKACNKISHNMMLVSFEHFVLFSKLICCDYFFLDILERPFALLIVFLQNFSKKSLLISEKGSNIVDRKFLENHVVLGQCSCFITENVLDPSKFFWNLAVSGQGSLNFLVIVNFPWKHNFGKIQIDSQTDGNYTGKQKYLSEQIQHPVLSHAPGKNDNDSQNDHENKQNFGEVIKFSIGSSHFGPGFVCIHDTSHLSSWVNDNPVCFSIGQETISP
jgi:hypothetical protein